MLRSVAENPKRIIAMRFMWIPGKMPVRVPADTPMRRATKMVNNIKILLYVFLYNFMGCKEYYYLVKGVKGKQKVVAYIGNEKALRKFYENVKKKLE